MAARSLMVPAVGQQDPANIEEDYVEGEHRRLKNSGQ